MYVQNALNDLRRRLADGLKNEGARIEKEPSELRRKLAGPFESRILCSISRRKSELVER